MVVDGIARSSRTIGIALYALPSAPPRSGCSGRCSRSGRAQEAAALGAVAAIAVAVTVWLNHRLADAPVRAGAAALALGVGGGIAAILGASATYGLYAIAIGAGAGAFLLVQMLTNRRTAAGATLALPAAAAARSSPLDVLLAKLAWYALVPLVLVPLVARLPVPERAPVWLQAVILSVYAFTAAAVSWVLAWQLGLE